MRQIAIVDDAEEVRLIWRAELALDPYFSVCAEGTNGEQAVEIARSLRPDVMLLDLAMPVMGGLEALPLILAASPSTKVVVLSAFGRREFSRTAGALGACGFLEKRLRPGSLPARLREVLDGSSAGQWRDCPPVLVVDPDEDNQELARHLLEWLGYRADIVADVRTATTLPGLAAYAAILLSHQLPDAAPAEAAVALRRRLEPHPPVPLIVMARGPEPGRDAWLAAGFTDCLSMPLVSPDLDAVLARHGRRSEFPDGGVVADAGQDVDQNALATLIDQLGTTELIAILESFRTQTQDRLTHLQAAISTGDAREVTRLAHAIKGAAAGVGALRMESVSRELEFLAAAGSLDGSRDRVGRLRAAFDRTVEVIAAQGYLRG